MARDHSAAKEKAMTGAWSWPGSIKIKRIGFRPVRNEAFPPENFTYETGNPETPFWRMTWIPFDQGANVSTILDVAVYAHDGSICGYRIAVPVG